MSEPLVVAPDFPMSGEQGRHYEFIKNAIPACLTSAAPQRRMALQQTPSTIPDWYAAATAEQREQLNRSLDARCDSQNKLDQLMANVQEVNAFAHPLLTEALKAAGHALDVDRVCLRLYVPVDDSFGRRTSGYRTKTLTLLEAALNNFEEQEAQAGFFNAASGFITLPDARGHFVRHSTTLKIEDFAQLCRRLDLGAQYQAYLNRLLRPDNEVARQLLRIRYLASRKDDFKAAANLALLKGDIGEDDFALLMRVANGEKNIRLGDKQVWYRTPCLMNLHLQGCVIIDPCVAHQYSDWFIVYIPDDPDHPIKRYESFAAFRHELTRQLTTWPVVGSNLRTMTGVPDYQRFFSRFIAHKDRPYYYRRFTETVIKAPSEPWLVRWLRSEQGAFWAKALVPSIAFTPLQSILGDPRYTRQEPREAVALNINADAIKGLWEEVDLWDELYEGMLARVFDDARTLAISTADTDAASRSRRLAHYLNTGTFVGGVVLTALSMAIPPLGAVMAVATAGQLLYEVLEGAVELGEGDREAGLSHIMDVVENLAMLVVGGVAFHFTVSPLIESMKQVQLPNGKTRLWKPDLKPYARDIPLAPGSAPNSEGLHLHDGQTVLPLEGKHFVVSEDLLPDTYRIQHPSRADAYQPQLRHNGRGAWLHEAEQPRAWQGATLMRRLGAAMDGFSDSQLEQIRTACGVSEDTLRRVHADSRATPALLLDTARQFRAYADAVSVSEQIAAGELSDGLYSYAAAMMTELAGWPASKGIEVYEAAVPTRAVARYGSASASGQDLIRISRSDLMHGQLSARVVENLDRTQRETLLGKQLVTDSARQIETLTARLAMYAKEQRTRLFSSLYTEQQPQKNLPIQILQRDFKGVPTLMAGELVAGASADELAFIAAKKRLPLRLAEQARRAQAQTRLVRAYEGLYLEALDNPDTEALALHSLENLPGWHDDLRLEVRDGSFHGALRASFGELTASSRKVVVRVADGLYEAFDEQGNGLHGANGLYDALQHALTDAHRTAIGLPHVGQGWQLKALIAAKALPREQLRKVLRMQPESLPFFRWPRRLTGQRLGYPLSGRGAGSGAGLVGERVRTLYPSISDAELEQYLQGRDLENAHWLRALEDEFRALDSALRSWVFNGPRDAASLQNRLDFQEVMIAAWRRSGERDLDVGNRYVGQKIMLTSSELGEHLETLPALPGNFDHVSSVSLNNCQLTDESLGFLAKFPRLRELELDDNELTQLPAALEHMPYLDFLSMADNEIELTEATAGYIRNMTRLQVLSLEGNPLGCAPDLSRMSELRAVYLAGCELNAWPLGLFAKPRSPGFILELGSNPLSEIPDVAPGSDRALLLARTQVSREQLAPDVLSQLSLYIESVGLDPASYTAPRGLQDSIDWITGLTPEQFLRKQETWNAIEEAEGSEPFFNELRKLSASSDAASAEYKEELTDKVWRMLEAMAADTALRDRLFKMAAAPTTCVDAGAQLFNAMGVEVLVQQANAIEPPALRTLELLDLAKGRSRLDELSRIARARVSELLAQGRKFPIYDDEGAVITQFDEDGNAVRSIDEVEIHLAYATRLASRLDLPWQSRSMTFAEPDVTELMLEGAAKRVQALEAGELLRDNLLEQPFWADHVQASNPVEFKAMSAKVDALADLQEAQQQWRADGGLAVQEKQALKDRIEADALLLGKAPTEVSPGRVMTEQEYDAELDSLWGQRKTLFQTLTDQMMGRVAG
ncbi:dermonecrotic toxin domain-containing protein [Pseudomonas sp. S1_E04]